MSDIELTTHKIEGTTHSWAFTDDEGIDITVKHVRGSGVISLHDTDPSDGEGEQVAVNACDAPKVIAALQAALQIAAESGVYRHNEA